jgi:hypothetical protein
MQLSRLESSLLLAMYFRGMLVEERWVSNSDQIVTLSLFYTGDLSGDECARRFLQRSYKADLYEQNGDLKSDIANRYRELIKLLQDHPDLIEGGGDFETPAYPTYTSCRLTSRGVDLIPAIIDAFPAKPDFPNWPDKRRFPKDDVP